MVATERSPRPAFDQKTLGNSSGNLREFGPTRNLQDLLKFPLKGESEFAAQVLDWMGLKESVKVDFLRYYIWQENGASALKPLGDIRDDSLVSLWERLSEEPERKAYGAFSFLMREQNFEVLKAKQKKISHHDIAIELKISPYQVIQISRRLILARLTAPSHPANVQMAEDYREFCDEVALLRKKGMANFEIAQELRTTINRVSREAEDLIAIGEIEAIDPIKAREKLPKYKEGKLLKQKAQAMRRTRARIPVISEALLINASKTRRLLYSNPKAPRIRQSREYQKSVLRNIIQGRRERGEKKISIRSLQREKSLKASWRRIKELVVEIDA